LNVTIRKLAHAAVLLAVVLLMTVATAGASTLVTYSTNATGSAGTGFNGLGNLVLNNASGATATLTYDPNVSNTSGTPSNIDFGDFTLVCATCSNSISSVFGAFTFDLVITESSPSVATGEFVGTSSGGTIFGNASNINIAWTPTELGPGGHNALTGDFGYTDFEISSPTEIVAPNSGTPPGQTTVQGIVDSSTPEPATLGLIGGSLVGLSLLRRRRPARR
jgi:hypothetical protein